MTKVPPLGTDASDAAASQPGQDAPETLIAAIENVIFPSDPLDRTYQEIRIPVTLRTSGCWFGGASGQGKSTAMAYCLANLQKEFSGMPAFALNVHMLPATASRSIPLRLLDVVEHGDTTGEPTRLRLRLARHLAERASRTPLRQCVLLLDEAQALRPQDLFLLKDLSNDLALLGVGFLTIIFGESPKIEEVEQRTRSGEDFGLAERFFVKECVLAAYESRLDWESLLKAIDDYQVPELGDLSVPQKILLDASGTPHLMQGEASKLWDALQRAKDDGAVAPTLRRIFTAIRWWLLHASKQLAAGKAVPDEAWAQAIRYATCVE